MMGEMPDIDVGSPPDSDDPNVTISWWCDANDALRDHMDDWIHSMVGSHTSMAPRYEEREVERTESTEVPDGNGGVTMETRRWTETEKRVVGEKKVCHGHYISVEITSEAERKAVMSLAHNAGLTVTELGGSCTRFTHRLEA